MTQDRRSRLTEALYYKLVVEFWGPYEPGSSQGYVLDIGPRFFLLGLIDENMKFNGYQCLRISDVRRLQVPHPYAEFVVAALRKRRENIRRKPNINLGSPSELLKSANRRFPLVTLHRERVNPETCKIGRVIGVTKSHLSLLEIGPDAIWEEEPTEVRLSEITRVDFGGSYEEALHIVGGKPKAPKSHPRTSQL
jgi:hypothetical protein